MKENSFNREPNTEKPVAQSEMPGRVPTACRAEKTIRNLVFDMAGVLMAYHWNKPLADLGLPDAEQKRLMAEFLEDEIWISRDLGQRTAEEAKTAYRLKYPADADVICYYMDHLDEISVELPEIWQLVHQLKEKGYHIYLLSNYPQELFDTHTAQVPFVEDMDGMLLSCQVGICKPDAKIYRTLLDRFGLQAEESLFFDDRKANTDAAERIGFHVFEVKSIACLAKELERILREEDPTDGEALLSP